MVASNTAFTFYWVLELHSMYTGAPIIFLSSSLSAPSLSVSLRFHRAPSLVFFLRAPPRELPSLFVFLLPNSLFCFLSLFLVLPDLPELSFFLLSKKLPLGSLPLSELSFLGAPPSLIKGEEELINAPPFHNFIH